MILDTAKEILQKGYVCDNCLGRQFAQILSGMTNRERGSSVRTVLAMDYSLKPFPLEKSNFSGMNFRKISGEKSGQIEKHERKREGDMSPSSQTCKICGGLFERLGRFAEEAVGKLKPIEYRTFAVSTILSGPLVRAEENLWEEIGIEYCEPMRSELNRELGKLIALKTGKEPDEKKPDISVILNTEKDSLELMINPVFIYGRYQKLVRGIPQTKWEKYRETVEDIIARPFMKASSGSGHSLHCAGREDIDARCLDWRPFVLEIESPKKREFSLKRTEAEVNRTRKVKVSSLRYSDKDEVVRVKSLMPDKTYKVLALSDKPIPTSLLSQLKKLSLIKQQTPTRVVHRRADKTRAKKVRSISWRILSKNRIEFIIKGEAGLYIKELVTGDNGRTKPSFSEVLGAPLKVKELDVVKIHLSSSR